MTGWAAGTSWRGRGSTEGLSHWQLSVVQLPCRMEGAGTGVSLSGQGGVLAVSWNSSCSYLRHGYFYGTEK